jgi:uncharacterized protein
MSYRSALVTGANSGIGAAFVEALAGRAEVLLAGRHGDQLAALVERVAAPGLGCIAADLATPGGCERVVAAARRRGVDLFVHNAAVARYGPFLGKPLADELDLVRVNVLAAVELFHSLIPILLQNAKSYGGRAGLIALSSTAAVNTAAKPNMATYGASKSFMLRLVESLAAELKDEPIDFLALCPTYTATSHFARAGIPVDHLARPMMSPQEVVRQGLAAIGQKTVHVCQ